MAEQQVQSLPERPESSLRRRFLQMETPRDLAQLVGIPFSRLVYLAYKMPPKDRYHRFEIPKKSGGTRPIAAPCRGLKVAQRALNRVLQAVYVPKDTSHGFVLGRNVVTNAQPHRRKRHVLNVDLEGFFPSINRGRIWGLFRAGPYFFDHPLANILAEICCHDNALPQGAPTSPVLSNIICRRMDRELQALARRQRCVYTRYADDITFSTSLREFPSAIAGPDGSGNVTPGEQLVGIVEGNGFKLNPRKTRLQHKTERQEVTGLTTNEFVNVSRKYLRQVRAMLHAWERYGTDAAQDEYVRKYAHKHRMPERGAPSFKRVVIGKINYVRMVRGEHDSYFACFRDWAIRCDESVATFLGHDKDSAEVTKNTQAAAQTNTRKLVVKTEGETDPTYITTALAVLGYQDLLDVLDVEWIGKKNATGNAIHTGKSTLTQAWRYLSANPPEQPVLLLYDPEEKTANAQDGTVWKRRMPANPANAVIKVGIEHLLPPGLATEEFYKVVKKNDGGEATSLDKTRFCEWVCTSGRDPTNFEGFKPLVQILQEFAHEFRRDTRG